MDTVLQVCHFSYLFFCFPMLPFSTTLKNQLTESQNSQDWLLFTASVFVGNSKEKIWPK